MTDSRPAGVCGHCGEHPAIGAVNGLPLCIDCFSRLQAADEQRIRTALEVQDALGREANFLGGMIEQTVGIPGLVPRFQPRERPAVGPVTQNFSIHDNAIGVLNTGTIQHLDQEIGTLRGGGDVELADALKGFVEAAANEEGLSDEDKRELLEGIELILEQATAAPERQRRGLLRTVLARIKEVAGTVAVVAAGWQHLEPLLKRAFPSIL